MIFSAQRMFDGYVVHHTNMYQTFFQPIISLSGNIIEISNVKKNQTNPGTFLVVSVLSFGAAFDSGA